MEANIAPQRKKVPAKKGYGLYDWMKIVNTVRNLSGTSGTSFNLYNIEMTRKPQIDDGSSCET